MLEEAGVGLVRASRMDLNVEVSGLSADRSNGGDVYATKRRSVGPSITPALDLLAPAPGHPMQLGRYSLNRVLGEGTMGTVYLADDTQLGRPVALKVPKFRERDIDAVKRFEREVRAMAALRHPNLCPAFDVGEIEGTSYFTMAYIDGQTLAERLDSGAPMPVRHVVMIIRKLAMALHTAHAAGIVHRDLKPANIIIDRSGEPVLMDFGLARLIERESTLTEEGLLVGTPAYMSPEQVVGSSADVGPQSDVYSLGAIMYEMLTGCLPFDGEMVEVLEQVLQDEPPPPSLFRAGIDVTLEGICLKALAKNPSDRYASAIELVDALQDHLRSQARDCRADRSGPKQAGQFAQRINQVQRLRSTGQYESVTAMLDGMLSSEDPTDRRFVQWASCIVDKLRARKHRLKHRWKGAEGQSQESDHDVVGLDEAEGSRSSQVERPEKPAVHPQRKSLAWTLVAIGLVASLVVNAVLLVAFLGRAPGRTDESPALASRQVDRPQLPSSKPHPSEAATSAGGSVTPSRDAESPSSDAETDAETDRLSPGGVEQPMPDVADAEEDAASSMVSLASLASSILPVVGENESSDLRSAESNPIAPAPLLPSDTSGSGTSGSGTSDQAETETSDVGKADAAPAADSGRSKAEDAFAATLSRPEPKADLEDSKSTKKSRRQLAAARHRAKKQTPPLPTDGLFNSLDRNSDDHLTIYEVGLHDAHHFHRADVNRNGRLSREEVFNFWRMKPPPPRPNAVLHPGPAPRR